MKEPEKTTRGKASRPGLSDAGGTVLAADGSRRASDGGDRGATPRLLNWGQGVAAVATVFVATLVILDHYGNRAEILRQVHARNRLGLDAVRANIEDYFNQIQNDLQLVSLHDKVRAMSDDARPFVNTVLQQNHDIHRLSEMFIVERDFTGTKFPRMTFELGDHGQSVVGIHTPEDEEAEYRAVLEQMRRFAENPRLEALVSPSLHLCMNEPGVVFSVPIRDQEKLVGLVAGMIPIGNISRILQRGQSRNRIILSNDRGDVFTSDVGAIALAPAVAAAIGERSGRPSTDDGFRRCSVGTYTVQWSEAALPGAQTWRLASLYDPDEFLLAGGAAAHALAAWGTVLLVMMFGASIIALCRIALALGWAQRQADQQARERAESEAQVRAILETAVDGIITIDEKGMIRAYNKAAERMFGYGDLEVRGKNINILMPAPYRDEHDGYLARYLSTGEKRIIGIGREVVGRRKDGTEFPIELAVSEVNLSGRRHFTGFVRDVSERHAAAAALRDSEERFRTLVEGSFEGILVSDGGVIVDCNPRLAELVGRTPSELIGTHDIDLVAPESIACVNRIRAEGRDEPYEVTFITADQTSFVAECWEKQAPYNGRTMRVTVVRDVTELKHAQAEMTRLAAIPTESPMIIVELDQTGSVTYRNPATEEFLTRHGLPVERCDALLPPDFSSLVKTCLRERKDIVRREHCVAGRTLSWSFHPVPVIECVHAYALDVTTQKRLEESIREHTENLEETNRLLEEANEKAEAARRAKGTLLAHISHEIRTPITAILGFAEILQSDLGADGCETRCVEAVDTIKRGAEHLLVLVNDVLDVSKIEAGKITLESVSCDYCQIIADVYALMKPRAEEKGLDFTFECRGPVPDSIQTDPTRLRQILLNLVGNAVKFTDAGSVRIVVQMVATTDDGDSLLAFEVTDTGCGMTNEEIAGVFEPFAQSGPATTRKYGGTGLGLTISRELAHMLGGDITVESPSGEGSTFRLTIATGELDDTKMVDRSSGDLAPLPSTATPLRDDLKLDCRILLAEDDPDSRRLISLLLERAGADMTVAENGQVANRIALDAWRDGRAFDVILMDICMPVLDGYAATRALRRQGYTNPIIALTANTLDTSHDSCVAAGFDDLATKPIDCNALSKAILALVPAPAST